MTPEISVADVARRRAAGDTLVVLDVREPFECATASIPGVLAVPMREVPARLAEIPRDVPLAVLCHHGARSERVTAFLRAQGFAHAVNIAGGIDAWSLDVDPAVPRY